MKKLLLLIPIISLFFMSCNKDTIDNNIGQVQFSVVQTPFENFKNGLKEDTVPQCSDLEWSYAKFEIGGNTYVSPIIEMPSGDMLTQSLKLDTGDYNLTSFYVFNNNNTPNDTSDDILVRAAPKPNSKYWSLMENKLNIPIHVNAFKKKSFDVDVLCYQDLYYEQFGFSWFDINDVSLERLCVFGDVCTGKLSDFNGSLYEDQENGVQMDMPAIFKIDIYKNGVFQKSFSNESFLGEGNCTEIYWANDVNLTENYYLVLKVLLPYGPGFSYITVDSIPFTDNGTELITGDDGVLDFTVGNCNIENADYVYPAWINVPDPNVIFNLTIQPQLGPSQYGTYFGYDFDNIPVGFDVWNGGWSGWCGDKYTTINVGHVYQAYFVNSLQPLPDGFRWTREQVNYLNWLVNHLPEYFNGIDLTDFTVYGAGYSSADWEIIQNAIWNITNGLNYGGLSQTISNDAITNGGNYNPLPGEYAIIFIDFDGNVQLQMILIDP